MSPEQLQRLSALLDEALDLDVPQRAGWLDALERTDAELGATLRSLLARDAAGETGELLERGPQLALPAASDFTTGQRIGPYRLLRELGAGGMGEVWLAERADGAFTRQVALKLPTLGARRALLVQRFARERDILAGLEHPLIARLYDAGVAADGQPYLALEYVEGEPIDAWCRAHDATLEQRIGLVLQVAEAVAFAHSRLVVHRDLKPGNILVTAQGEVRLLDFGIAKLVEGDAAGSTELTRLGGRALTPAYASPEQIRGEAIGTPSDLYSLGVIAFELLAGVRPYKAEDFTPGALPEWIAAEAPLASRCARDPALARRLRGDLDAILARAMHKAPAARYPTVDAFANDLRAHLQGRDIVARGGGSGQRLVHRLGRRLWRRRGALALAVGALGVFALAIGLSATLVLALALGTGLALALWQARRARRERDRARRAAQRLETVATFLNTLVVDAARGGQRLDAETLMRRSEHMIAQELGPAGSNAEDADAYAMVLSMIGTAMQTLGNSAEALRLGEQALALVAGSDDADLLDTLRAHHALTVGWSGRYDEARSVLLGIAGREDAMLERRTEAHHYLVQLANLRNDPQTALHHAELALQSLRSQRRPPRRLEASILTGLGAACSLAGRMAEAERHYAAAFERLRALGQENSPHAVTLLNNWSVINERAGDARQSLKLVDRALELGGPDGRSPFLLANRARALEHLGRLDEAVVAYAEAAGLAAERRMALPQAHSHVGLASVALHRAQPGAARAALADADAAGLGEVPPQHPFSITRSLVVARLAQAEGRPEEARSAFEAALAAAPQQATSVTARLGLADLALSAGDALRALEWAGAALALAQSLQGGKAHSFRTGLAAWQLARAEAAAGRANDASLRLAREHLVASVDGAHPARRALDA